jgi:hypothetical protein
MTGRVPRPGYTYYGCNNSLRSRKVDKCEVGYIPAAETDALVWGLVEKMANAPTWIAARAEQTREANLPKLREEEERIERAIKDAQREIAVLVAGYAREEVTGEELASGREQRESDIAAWQERLGEVRGAIADEERQWATVDRVAEITAKIAGRSSDSIPLHEKRSMLQELGMRATVLGVDEDGEQKVKVKWAGDLLHEPEPMASSVDNP